MRALGEILLKKFRVFKGKMMPEGTALRWGYDWLLARVKRFFGVIEEQSLGEEIILQYRVAKGRMFPFGSRRRRFYERITTIFRKAAAYDIAENHSITYEEWLAKRHPSENVLYGMQREINEFSYQPKIAIGIIAREGVELTAWQKSIKSIASQVYHNWKIYLIGAGDLPFTKQEGSPVVGVGSVKDFFADKENDFAGFIYPGDIIQPHGLFKIVQQLNIEKEIDLVYCDNDWLSQSGAREKPFFKPDWSPDLLMGMNYLGRFFCVKTACLENEEGLDSNLYKMILIAGFKCKKISHIPNILCSYVSYQPDSKAEKKDLEYIIRKRGPEAEVLPLVRQDAHRVRYKIAENFLVSVIIPTAFSNPDIFRKCFDSLVQKTSYRNIEIIVMDNSRGALAKGNIAMPKEKCRIMEYKEEFNYARINNMAAKESNGAMILFLNDDTEVLNSDWIDAMLEHCQRREIGVVGAKLLYPDRTVQHGGIFFTGKKEVIGRHSFRFVKDGADHYGFLDVVRNTSAVTGACMMIRREVFRELNGFNETLVVECNDADLCLRAIEKGYRIVWTPFARLLHYEAVSRIDVYKPLPKDRITFWNRWKVKLEKGDPYFNPNLSVDKEDYSLKPIK
ncbi:MAG: glycosyltransferase family 2 protein [Planctomycetota bacterium]